MATSSNNLKSPFVSLRLADIPTLSIDVLREPSSTRPALWLIEKEGTRAVVKDFSVNRFLYRHLVGRFLVWRESKAYRRLRGLKGVPALYGVIDGLALVFEELQGRNVEGMENETRLPKEFFTALRALLAEIHLRGLAHCDLKRAPNILLDNDQRPYIVDWSAAIMEREFRFFPLNLIYRRFIQDDLNALVKLELRHHPEDIDPGSMRIYAYRSRPEKMIRAFRDKTRDLLQRLF
jgi:serine/threonine protein kinase